MTVRTAALAVALAACGRPGPEKDPTPSGHDTAPAADSGTPPTDSGTPPGGGFVPQYLTISGDFPWDGAANQLVDVTLGGLTISPAIRLEFGDAAWQAQGFDASLTDHYCSVELPLTSSALATWAQADPDVYYGVDFTGTVDDVVATCGDAGHPMTAAFGADDIRDALLNGYGTWGLGVGKPGPPFTQLTTTFLGDAIGAFVQTELVPTDGAYAIPIAIDPVTHEAQVDQTDYTFRTVPPDQVFDGVSLATAWYRISEFYAWEVR